MVAKKPTDEESTETKEITMEPFDKEYVVIETAYDTYKLRRPRGPKTGRDHLRLIQKWTSKLSYNEQNLEARREVLEKLVSTGLTNEESALLLAKCGLTEPADPMQLEVEAERQEKAEEEWFDKVLPDILVGKSVDEIPAEDFKPIFTAMYSNIKVRPDYFRIL